MVWAALISAAATVGAAALKGGGAGAVQAPSNLTNGGQGGFSSDNWSVVTGKNNKQDAKNSELPQLDWKLVAVLGLTGALLWKTSRNRR